MPICCRCNGSGRCRNCSCTRSGNHCVDCLPTRRGRCDNINPQPVEICDTADREGPLEDHDHRTSGTNCNQDEVERRDRSPNETPRCHTEPPALPTFEMLGPPNFIWGELDGTTFTRLIDKAYNEIIHWRRNLFKIPHGKAGTLFVNELARLLSAYADGTTMENIAMKAAMTTPALLLQRPHQRSRSADNVACLKDRMERWKKGEIDSLLHECHSIQSRLVNTDTAPDKQRSRARSFARLMGVGNVKAALRMITEKVNTGSLLLDSLQPDGRMAKEHLLEKHTPRQQVKGTTICQDEPETEPHPVIFDGIDGVLIRSTVLKTTGSAGPSGLDAAGWRRMCSSFGRASNDLCSAVARVARRLCSTYVDPRGLTSFVAYRLIALDKCPGVRPIGVGEVLRRVIGKAVLETITDDIQKVVGTLQMCVGQISGCEAGVHAMRHLKGEPNTEAILLVDASNAFNSLNREAAMRNAQVLCPSIAKILINTYRDDSPMFIDHEIIYSEEGTTQGDPLAMHVYAVGTLPLICRLPNSVQHIWFADDASAGGQLHHLRTWWNSIQEIGPEFGYFSNAEKSWLIVKEDYLPRAESVFGGTGINISVQGKNHLGAPLGTDAFAKSFISAKVEKWVEEIKHLSVIAESQPHAAYSAMTNGLVGRWTFLMRVVPDISDLLQPLEDAIRIHLLPAITGRAAISDAERRVLALPVRDGGLGIPIPTALAVNQFKASSLITQPLVSLLTQQHTEDPVSPDQAGNINAIQMHQRKETSKHHREKQQEEVKALKQTLPAAPPEIIGTGLRKGSICMADNSSN